MAEIWGKFGNPEQREHPPLEAFTRGMVKTQQIEETKSVL
jgi:hypothetical protein